MIMKPKGKNVLTNKRKFIIWLALLLQDVKFQMKEKQGVQQEEKIFDKLLIFFIYLDNFFLLRYRLFKLKQILWKYLVMVRESGR